MASESAEMRIFPRVAALAERLWSDPRSGWYQAQNRMLQHRLRLTHRGINANLLQPEWCRSNEGQCYIKTDNPTLQARPRLVDETAPEPEAE